MPLLRFCRIHQHTKEVRMAQQHLHLLRMWSSYRGMDREGSAQDGWQSV
jgi:hypothetical protein